MITSFAFVGLAQGVVSFESGEYEPVDYYIYDTISIDNDVFHDPGTHVELLPGGLIQGAVYAYHNSRFSLNGGRVNGRCLAHDNTLVTIKAGTISIADGNLFFVYENSNVELFGSNFSVDGTPVGFGESLKDYAVYNGTFYNGELTGTLLDGSSLSGDFYIYNNADMVVFPEPAMLLLLALGGPAMLRRRGVRGR
jgi:hypothetical protein